MNFKVIFHLDGSGLIYDPNSPIHLDALIHWCLTPFHRTRQGLGRDETPDEIELPLLKHQVNGEWVWQASALFPAGKTVESLQHWRKRFRQNRIELTSGSPNLQNGPYREYNMPLPVLHTLQMIAYGSGNAKEIRRLLKQIKYLGKKRAYGKGSVISCEVLECPDNYAILRDGKTMRWIPDLAGARLIRPRPPYWNIMGRVLCKEIDYDTQKDQT